MPGNELKIVIVQGLYMGVVIRSRYHLILARDMLEGLTMAGLTSGLRRLPLRQTKIQECIFVIICKIEHYRIAGKVFFNSCYKKINRFFTLYQTSFPLIEEERVPNSLDAFFSDLYNSYYITRTDLVENVSKIIFITTQT